MNVIDMQISDINAGERHRRDLGDIRGLARSIDAEKLHQPIGVTPSNELVFGMRRLVACRDVLGWKTIPARIIELDSNTM